MKLLLLVVLFIAPFVAMYLYADAQCIPEQHTLGFCGRWVAMGMVFPTFFWIFVALIFGQRS